MSAHHSPSSKRLTQLLFGLSLCGGLSACSDIETDSTKESSLSRASTDKAQKGCGAPLGGYFEFLDDTYCKKQLPLDRDRGFMCPTSVSSEALSELNSALPTPYAPATEPVVFDQEALKGVVPPTIAT